MAKIGDRVNGNWGAMHPTSSGVVIEVGPGGCLVQWDDETPRGWYEVKDARPAQGSPIGVFLDQDARLEQLVEIACKAHWPTWGRMRADHERKWRDKMRAAIVAVLAA